MKISDSNLNSVTTSTQQAGQAAGTAGRTGTGTKAETGRGDRVDLSGLSNTLKSLAAGSPEREARISQLASAYQSRNYHVEARAVSKSLITDAFAAH